MEYELRQKSRPIRPRWLTALPLLAACSAGVDEMGAAIPSIQSRIAAGVPASETLDVGDVVDQPGARLGETQRFFVDANSRGRADEIRIASVSWGRLVDVYGLDSQGHPVIQQRDMVIDAGLATDGVDFRLEGGPISQVERLVILRDVTDTSAGGGLDSFIDLLRVADSNLTPIDARDPSDAGLFSMVPRNAVVVVQFDDLLDASLITPENLRMVTGQPPSRPFEQRVLADTNHGSLAVLPGESQRRFFTTRVLLDFAITPVEAMGTLLPVQATGLPGATQTVNANLLLRIPSREDVATGQTSVLRNPTGGSLATSSNGPVDFSSATSDVIRAARSGGPTSVTGDPSNGYLVDLRPPQVVGSLASNLDRRPRPIAGGSPFDFTLPRIQFASTFCARAARAGDVVEVPGFLAEVTGPAAVNAEGQAFDVPITLLGGDPAAFRQAAIGAAVYQTVFDPALDAHRAACFVTVQPTPASGGAMPISRISPASIFEVHFTEALDAAQFEPHETLALARVGTPAQGSDYVVGDVTAGLDFSRFQFIPALPLAHQNGTAENVYLTLSNGPHAPVDLVGNALTDALPQVAFRIDGNAATAVNGGRVTRFASDDEEEPFGNAMTGPLPEWSGQFQLDATEGIARPRPVTRMLAAADRTQSVPGIMTPLAAGVQVPLSPLGAKSQALWRHVDVGFSIDDPTQLNLDVEGLNWSPVNGQVVSDSFTQFEIRLSHAQALSDEFTNPLTLFPAYPLSGPGTEFATNTLEGTNPKVVHPRQSGYTIDPGDLFVSSGGTALMPFPLNRSVAPDQYETYTWRDTALQGRGAPFGDGADPASVTMAGLPRVQLYSKDEVPSAGLPLLMEFRCYPDAGAVGLNSLDVSIAVNSSARPFFRAFSAGGINSSGSIVTVDPDLETVANGGFNSVTGGPTIPADPVFHIGAMDLVVRVSQMVSVWFSAESSTGAVIQAPQYAPAIVFPAAQHQPIGTRVELAYRGASAITAGSEVSRDARTLDVYGDGYGTASLHDSANANLDVSFIGGDADWQSDPQNIGGSRYYQMRLILRSNIASGETPTVSSIGQAWSE